MPPEIALLLSFLPPWLLLAVVLGVMNASACFLLLGRKVRHLVWYAVIGAFAGGLGQVLALALEAPAPILIGDLNVLMASLAAWSVVTAARVAGL